MTLHDPELPKTYQTSMGEVPFELREIFYSRTDDRGVILEGNGVFRRISGFEWSELKGAPHKLVRHPDMPKGVFRLMWDRLKDGKEMVAYVKNRTKDGRFYWVLALTWRLEDGYLSVRIKPQSPLFAQIPPLYAALLEEERKGLNPEQSAKRLESMIAGLGFRSYESFMAAALATETTLRQEKLGQTQDQVERRFAEMYGTVQKIGIETEEMTGVIRAIRTVPMNMRILASRLENAGGPISAISVNYGSMLDEMATWVRAFADGPKSTYARIHDTIQRGHFLVCAAALQREMSEQFERDLEGASDRETLEADRITLRDQAVAYARNASASLKTVETEVTRLSRSVLDMKRYVTGLSSTRMMCKIESAALHGAGDSSLAGIVDQLDAGQNEIEDKLARIVQLNGVIQGHSGMLRSLM